MMADLSEPYEITRDRLRLFFRLTPGSSKDEIFALYAGAPGVHGPHFKARVRAQPEKGKANKALLRLVAEWLHIPKSHATLKSGSQSRLKTVEIRDPAEETIEILKKNTDTLS